MIWETISLMSYKLPYSSFLLTLVCLSLPTLSSSPQPPLPPIFFSISCMYSFDLLCTPPPSLPVFLPVRSTPQLSLSLFHSLQLLSEVLDGIKTYFDFTLADHLLYVEEKEQHNSLGVLNPVFYGKKTSSHVMTEEDMERRNLPSHVYGPAHLLRLFVQLPQFLTCTQMPPGNLHLLQLNCKDLLGYVVCNCYMLYSRYYVC